MSLTDVLMFAVCGMSPFWILLGAAALIIWESSRRKED